MNDIIKAIALKIHGLYEDAEVYIEQMKQGLEEPCFFVSHLDTVRLPMLGSRAKQNNLFMIQYFPRSGGKSECLEVAETLMYPLLFIEKGEDCYHGSGIKYCVVDNILNLKVSYNAMIKMEKEFNPMEEYSSQIGKAE